MQYACWKCWLLGTCGVRDADCNVEDCRMPKKKWTIRLNSSNGMPLSLDSRNAVTNIEKLSAWSFPKGSREPNFLENSGIWCLVCQGGCNHWHGAPSNVPSDRREKRLFAWCFSSHSRIFHSHGDVTIAGDELQMLTYAQHSSPLSSEDSLTYHI